MVLATSDAWLWQPHPEVWLLMGSILGAYALAARKWGPQHTSPGDPIVSKKQWKFFAFGISALWIGAEWPIHELSEKYLFSVHMIQHFIFSLIAPPLILLGIPDWMARRLLAPKWIKASMRFLTRPFFALIAFNSYMVISHTPPFIDTVVQSELLHFSAHAVLVGLAAFMWWSVFSPLPELPRLKDPVRLLYLFGQTIVPTVPASFLTFADKPLYRVYAEAPRVFSAMTPVIDQRVAGMIMKIAGAALLWAMIAVLFFRWSSRDETGTPDVGDWQALELELNKIGAGE